MTQDVTTLRHCSACGGPVDVEANFCPACGTRQIDGVPREPEPVVPTPDVGPPPVVVETPVSPAAASATAAWLVIGILVSAFVLVFLALLTARVLLRDGHDAGAPLARPTTAGPAAAAMDRFAPIEAGWRAKHAHVAGEGAGADSAGLATAAGDAHAWIDVNSRDLDAAIGGVPGAAGRLYQQLIDVYARRYAVLADIQSTATAGGTGPGAAAGQLAELNRLDSQAAGTVCAIGRVMTAEGDQPAAHLASLGVVC